ncbi:MAG: THUMP domain-containing protein, partial [Thermofilaceae archaeon]
MSEYSGFAMPKEGVTLCLLVSGAQPQLGAREAEAILGRSLTRLSNRLHIAQAHDTNELGEMLQRLYDSVLLQEAVIVKAISMNPPSGRDFYKSLAAACSWSELKNRSFAVTVRKLGGYPSISSMELAAYVAEGIIESLEGSFRVDLEAPDVNIRLITSKDAAVLGIQVLDLRGDRHRLRSKRFKVFKHPASLTPEDAGILVNLTGWRSPLIDPFCGS